MSTPYINAKQVKELALKVSKKTGRPFTRVSQEFIDGINALVVESIHIRVHRAPSIGKTLK
jgi:hypothetical protein